MEAADALVRIPAALPAFPGSPFKGPALDGFLEKFWTSGTHEIALADNHAKAIDGRVHWEQLRQNMRESRFDRALSI